MTRAIRSVLEVAMGYDAIILDQWGVLHDGSEPYPGAVTALEALRSAGAQLAVLSNSGKRASENETRIAAMGFPPGLFNVVMTSGEALWLDVRSGRVPERRYFAVERVQGDADTWAGGLDVTICDVPEAAEAILIMGLPESAAAEDWQDVLDHAMTANLTVYCSNPDRASPRSGDCNTLAPGALAHMHKENGGNVVFYGKPHLHVFEAMERSLGGPRRLMVGDSLEHDIAGAHGAGWDSVFVQGGLLRQNFTAGDAADTLARLCAVEGVRAPTYRMELLA
ncbi:MAG: TIGR01459 family HAD-type hydrolase [Boseongicola sp. SB0670_bin_30]|nr:TIGR01459 family HAD-type hydrolase [Boseongicola sp. SB0670_bin_30]